MSGSEEEVPVDVPEIWAFALVVDSTIRSHITKTNCPAHPMLKSAHVLTCDAFEALTTAMRQIKTVSDVCIVSCSTSFITCC